MKTRAQKQKDLEALVEQFKQAKAAMLVGFQKMSVAKDFAINCVRLVFPTMW
jgi:Rad3-related DNA helicase